MLTADQMASFRNVGFVVIERAIGEPEITAIRSRLWAHLERNGAFRDDRSTCTNHATVRLQAIRQTDTQPGDNPTVASALDQLFGPDAWKPPRNWGQALVTFPSARPWELPGGPWHLDYPYWFPPDEIWGMNVFLLVDEVGARGGGTLVVRGSHRLVEAFHHEHTPNPTEKQAALSRKLRLRYPWFADLDTALRAAGEEDALSARFMDADTEIEGVSVRVSELVGSAGDVVLCHPWLVHAASPNVSERPRLMRAARVFSRSQEKPSASTSSSQSPKPR